MHRRGRLVEVYTQPPRFTLEVGERPVASALARPQARSGRWVTNLRHESVLLDEVGQRLLWHLDGSRDRAALRDLLVVLVRDGELSVEEGGQPVTAADQLGDFAEKTVAAQLPELARRALLVG